MPRPNSRRCVFLSCADLAGYVHDDHLAVPALERRGWAVDTRAWDDPRARWAAYEVAVIRTTWDYWKRLDEFLGGLEAIERSGCRLMNPLRWVRWSSRKTYLRDLARAGIPGVPTEWITHAGGPVEPEAFPGLGTREIVVKPQVGAGGHRTYRVRAGDSETAARAGRDLAGIPVMVQPFVSEVVREGEISLHYFAGEFSHAIRKLPKPGEYRSQEEHGAEIRPHVPRPDELSIALRALEHVGEKLLYARVDMVRAAAGPLLMELEIIEPALYFRTAPGSEDRFAEALDAMA